MIEFTKAYIKFEYDNGFGDTTEMAISFPESPTIHEMQSAFCRFLLGAGWQYDNVKYFDPEYLETRE